MTPAPVDEGSDGDVDILVLVIALPLVFLCGAVLSAVYFGMRGRR
jgi:hypothetical protein